MVSAAMRFRLAVTLVLCALFFDASSYALGASRRRSCLIGIAAAAGLGAVVYGGSFYVREFNANERERQELQAAHEERAEILGSQVAHDQAQLELYRTGDASPRYMLIHEPETREAIARGETPIGFGIGVDRATLEMRIPELRDPQNNGTEIVRKLAAALHGVPPKETSPVIHPRTASSYLGGHNLLQAPTRERLVVVTGIAKEYGIAARLRIGWRKADRNPRSYAGNHAWVEFPALGLCVDTEFNREPVPLEQYLAGQVSYYINDQGHVLSTAGDSLAANKFESEALGHLYRVLARQEDSGR